MLRRTIHEQVADKLRKELLNGKILPGERIVESEVAETLGVSRGPVREALRQLSKEGFVSYRPHKGCEAKCLSEDEIRESYLIRLELECLAVQIYNGNMEEKYLETLESAKKALAIAAEKKSVPDIIEADEQFHQAIVEAAGKEKLTDMWKLLAGVNISAFYIQENERSLPYAYIDRNHSWILDAFKNHLGTEEIIRILREHYGVTPQDLYRGKVE